jgi:hypothetical protein
VVRYESRWSARQVWGTTRTCSNVFVDTHSGGFPTILEAVENFEYLFVEAIGGDTHTEKV